MFMKLYPMVLIPFVTMLLITSYTDFRYHRIANVWSFGGILIALLLQLILAGWQGMASGLGGMLVGFLLLLPMYLTGGMAAGDVKLMAAAGAFLGFKLTFAAVVLSLISGGLLAIAYVSLRGDLKALLFRYFNIIKLTAITRNPKQSYTSPGGNEAASQRFPYAIAIATGCFITLALFWR